MIIFVIDDEELSLKSAKRILKLVAPDAELHCFSSAFDALEAVNNENIIPDVVFSDIEMPEMSGIIFATQLKSLAPDARVIFVSAYSEYTVDAFKVRAQGYLMKPATVKDVLAELERVPRSHTVDSDKLEVKCFGHFEVFYKSKPLVFQIEQTKELLAFLIDKKGALCSPIGICDALQRDASDMSTVSQRVRNLVSDLKNTLVEIGMEDVLIQNHRRIAIQKNKIDCDYYRMLDGDVDTINSYKGEYMSDYSWAKHTRNHLIYNE